MNFYVLNSEKSLFRLYRKTPHANDKCYLLNMKKTTCRDTNIFHLTPFLKIVLIGHHVESKMTL